MRIFREIRHGCCRSISWWNYKELPLNTLALLYGNNSPSNVIRLLLKLGSTVAVHWLVPLVILKDSLAETPEPITFISKEMFPFLSVVISISEAFPSTVTPPIPLGPDMAVLKANWITASSPFNDTKFVSELTCVFWPRLNSTRVAFKRNDLFWIACCATSKSAFCLASFWAFSASFFAFFSVFFASFSAFFASFWASLLICSVPFPVGQMPYCFLKGIWSIKIRFFSSFHV